MILPQDDVGAVVDMPPAATNGVTNGTSPTTPGTAVTPAKSSEVNGYPKAGDGEWRRTGWEPRFGSLNDALGINKDDSVTDHQTFVEASLDDKFFGGNIPG
jgi:hypothetical protein